MHPWFSHAYKSGKTVYQSLTAFWVFSFFALIGIIALVVFYFFVKSIFEIISGNDLYSLICVAALGCFSFAIFISGMVPACFGLKNDDNIDGYGKMKCYMYVIEGLLGCNEWIKSQSLDKQIDYAFYVADLFSHMYKGYDAIHDDYSDYTNYYCADVAAPSLIFCLLLLAGWIIFIIVALPSIKNDSVNENQEPEKTEENPEEKPAENA